ncbi:aldo/keto reductase [Lacticaseibacillus brantae]|uniref:2,5-diketo-d-gluconate reductase n=1 Tax=Lacticaseibacillus brantae DSM 23927 TaxID=1423727 RepID=A0A0R2B6B4_9LACO|nr:aldo/keto reductase [Lacticaseibacillus brantae]KRM71979.1 2,5-diketo-d-gluconate reductase [Lacticaseibacillus brantae DSM 23927]
MSFQLNDGLTVPEIGFGTYQLNGATGVNTMVSALNNGYRLLDSAFNYENEGAVGQAIRQSGIPRTDILVSSKLPGRHHRYQDAIATIQESLYRAGLDYYDLYLIHWPNPLEDHYVEAWQALIDAQKFGLVRSIGVSNFLPEHLNRIIKETGVTPSLNQIELHPYFNQADQRQFDTEHHILTQAWSPLGRASEILNDQTLTALATKYHVSVVQLILKWDIQHGVMPIPKSSNPVRQRQNLTLDFTIDAADMAAIDQLTKPDGRTHDQDPARYQEF